MKIEELLEKANKAKEKAQVYFSSFRVGASLITKEGKIYTGCNIESFSLSLSFCAERVALLKALSEGEKNFEAVGIVSDSQEFCFPCGACRQMLWEFAPDIKIVLVNDKKERLIKTIAELLPMAFDYTKMDNPNLIKEN